MTSTCVFVSQRFPPDKGGNAARIHDIAVHLQDGDWDVVVLAPPPSYPPGEFDRSWRPMWTDTVDGVTVHRLWSWQPQVENPGTARRLAYYLLFGINAALWLLWNFRSYNLVVTSTPPISTGAPGLLAAALGTPWVVDVRDLWIDASISLGYLEAGSLLERVSRRFQRLVLHAADRVSVTTHALGESLCESYGEELAAKLVYVPNGVDVDRFGPGRGIQAPTDVATGPPTDDEKASTNYTGPALAGAGGTPDAKFDGGHSTIVYTGNLGSAQDLESCVRAMTHLSNDTAILRLVGRGDRESELQRLASDCGVEDRVEFSGIVPRDAVPGVLREATIGLAPLQDTEELAYAMPTKVYEYMAAGLPTLVTGRGQIEQFIEESGGGLHADNDPRQIADRLDELLADERLRERLANAGHEFVTARYSRKEIARRLGSELAELVEAETAQ